MNDLRNISVVLPSLDPDDKLIAVIDGLLNAGFTDIILVNDGSKQENLHYFQTAATHPEVTLLHHEVNRGKGAALKTAFTWFLENRPGFAGVVTVDGDNQHHPEDTRACALHMAESQHIVLGVRDFDQPDVPFKSRNGNKITSFVFKVFVGMIISDTQTGLRAIPRKDLEILNTVSGDRFEYETNMLLQMSANRIPSGEIPIETVYIEENKTSHFRPVRDSLRIYGLIIKFISSSLIASVVDLGIFFLLSLLMPSTAGTFTSTLIARICSSGVNYTVNKKAVFKSKQSVGKSLVRYYVLAAGIFVLSAAAMSLLTFILGMDEGKYAWIKTLIKFVVDSILFLISFRVQREWVFTDNSGKS